MAFGGGPDPKGEASTQGVLSGPRQLGEPNRMAAIQRYNRRANLAEAGKVTAKAGQRHNGIDAHSVRNPEAVETCFLGKSGSVARFIYGRQRRAARQPPADTKAIIRHSSKPLCELPTLPHHRRRNCHGHYEDCRVDYLIRIVSHSRIRRRRSGCGPLQSATVHINRDAGHEVGVAGGEERDDLGLIIGHGNTPQWRAANLVSL